MTKRYSNQRGIEEIREFIGKIKTRIDGIEENETLYEKDFEDRIELLIQEFIWLLFNEGKIETGDFNALPSMIRKNVKDLIKDIFGINCFKDD